jgi:hypothetical protein
MSPNQESISQVMSPEMGTYAIEHGKEIIVDKDFQKFVRDIDVRKKELTQEYETGKLSPLIENAPKLDDTKSFT